MVKRKYSWLGKLAKSNGVHYLVLVLVVLLNFSICSPVQAQILRDSFRFLPNPATKELYLTSVNDIFQIDNGLMYLGTNDGLIRFDGVTSERVKIITAEGGVLKNYEVNKIIGSKIYANLLFLCTEADGLIELNLLTGKSILHRHQEKEETSLRGNKVLSLVESKNGDFWVNTSNLTLSHYNRSTKRFQHFQPALKNKIKEESIFGEMTICPIQANRLWIASTLGLYRFNKANENFTLFPFENTKENSPQRNNLKLLVDPQEKVLWLGKFNQGLWRINPQNGHVLSNGVLFSDSQTFNRNVIKAIYAFDDNTILVSTLKDGFGEYDRQTRQLRNTFSLSGFSISIFEARSFFKSKNGDLWIGAKTGLYRFVPQQNSAKFISFEKHLPTNQDSTTNGSINSKRNLLRADLFSKDGQHLYLGTRVGDGLWVYDLLKDDFKLVRYQSEPFLKQGDVEMIDLTEDNQQRIWIASNDGLLYYQKDKRQIFKQNLPEEKIGDNKNITALALRNNLLYFGIKNQGLWELNTESGQLKPISETLNLISPSTINKLRFDSKGNLWVGTNTGLFIFDGENKQMLPYTKQTGGGLWLSEIVVYDLLETPDKTMYISTQGDGLVSYNPLSKEWKNYRSKNYQQNFMGELVWTNNQQLIIAAISQHLVFNPTLDYDVFPELPDFLPATGIERSLIAFPDGRLWCGGINGVLELQFPIDQHSKLSQSVYLKDVIINGQSNYTIPQLSQNPSLELAHSENTFSIKIGALNFSVNARNHFFQKLEGIDKNWIALSDNNTITYSKLPPGQYQYFYKAKNQFGEDISTPKKLDILIQPPWWRSRLAYIGWLGLVIGGLWLVRRQIIKREQLRNQIKAEQFEKAKMQELDQLRSQFIANISHEFRTPLTLIKTPLADLINTQKDTLEKVDFFRMHQNADRLLQLINQLLDLSKLEAGMLTLHDETTEIYAFLKQLIGQFQSIVVQKNIQLDFLFPEEPLFLNLDLDKLEKIIINLLSNAIKFTPNNGWIKLEVAYQQALIFKIGNSGDPIAPSELPKLFNRFYQTKHQEHQGTGIGLALVKELVKLHAGEVTVTSNLAEGTWFKVMLPLKLATEFTTARKKKTVELMPALNQPPVDNLPSFEISNKKDSPLLLVIDDHQDIQDYLHNILSPNYEIQQAYNGLEGLEKATTLLPDLIISDLMMPKMNGIDFCRQLKQDNRTDHIPVILLTAKADIESRLEGWKIGADEYLAKPFNKQELLLRIQNILGQRQKLRERLATTIKLEPHAVEIKSIEKQFLENAIEIVETNMSNASFSATDFAQAMLLSRTHLHRKLKNLTGHSAIEFIRHLRLQRAAQLLENNSANITQIAFQVGFNSQSYFTKCFRKKYGKSPSEFIAK